MCIQGKLLNCYGNKIPSLCFKVETYFKHLYQLLDLVLAFSDGLLRDFLDVHKKVNSPLNIHSLLSSFFKKNCYMVYLNFNKIF